MRGLDAPGRSRGLALRTLTDYAVRRVVWLDKPFLQRAAFHLLAGRKGVAARDTHCSLAARVHLRRPLRRAKRVLVVTSEDCVELDFKPRVLAAGGDHTLVESSTGEFRMPRDLDWLRRKALELGDVGMIVIDPIGNHLGGADTDKEGLVRDAIRGLNPLADELDCMIFGVRHLGKDVNRGALASVLGSTAWVDVPRAVILFARDDEDERIFHAQVVAGNRGPRNHGRAYRLELVDVPPATEITLAVPQGESTKDVEDLLGVATGKSEASKSTRARESILDLLDGCSEMSRTSSTRASPAKRASPRRRSGTSAPTSAKPVSSPPSPRRTTTAKSSAGSSAGPKRRVPTRSPTHLHRPTQVPTHRRRTAEHRIDKPDPRLVPWRELVVMWCPDPVLRERGMKTSRELAAIPSTRTRPSGSPPSPETPSKAKGGRYRSAGARGLHVPSRRKRSDVPF